MGRISDIKENLLQTISDNTGFRKDVIEKIIRMNDLMIDIFRHPYLKTRLLLKGGTGLNFCYLNRQRLSVDIDLNYIGGLDVDTMQKERPEITRALKAIINDQGYRILREPTREHAGGKWRLRYKDIFNSDKNLELDINFVYRQPIGNPIEIDFKVFDEIEGCKIRIVSKEELFAGKVTASLSRSLARDVYDLYNISGLGDYDSTLFKKTVIFLGVTMKKDFRKIKIEDVLDMDDNDFNNSLKPLLRSDDDITKEKLIERVRPFLEQLLEFSEEEQQYIDDYLGKGIFRPEILYADYPDMLEDLKKHPVALWKHQNVVEYLKTIQ